MGKTSHKLAATPRRALRAVVPASPAPGALFDRHSISWKLVSRWPVLVGGPAALLLQVAHPSVAAGVDQHSSYATDPFGRLERTLAAMLAISFGSPQRREHVLTELYDVHRRVTGTRSDGVAYRALDPELQLWVWATLVHVAIEVERRYIGELRRSERAAYYAESTEIARCFRVPERLIPADVDAFRTYVDSTVAGLEVGAEARAVARSVLHPEMWWIPSTAIVPFEWVTADLLGPDLADRYGLDAPSGPRHPLSARSQAGMSAVASVSSTGWSHVGHHSRATSGEPQAAWWCSWWCSASPLPHAARSESAPARSRPTPVRA